MIDFDNSEQIVFKDINEVIIKSDCLKNLKDNNCAEKIS